MYPNNAVVVVFVKSSVQTFFILSTVNKNLSQSGIEIP